jgi:hypothetical protein
LSLINSFLPSHSVFGFHHFHFFTAGQFIFTLFLPPPPSSFFKNIYISEHKFFSSNMHFQSVLLAAVALSQGMALSVTGGVALSRYAVSVLSFLHFIYIISLPTLREFSLLMLKKKNIQLPVALMAAPAFAAPMTESLEVREVSKSPARLKRKIDC